MKTVQHALHEIVHGNLSLSPVTALSLAQPNPETRRVLNLVSLRQHTELGALRALHEWRAAPHERRDIHQKLEDLLFDGSEPQALPSHLAGAIAGQIRLTGNGTLDQDAFAQRTKSLTAPETLARLRETPLHTQAVGRQITAIIIISELLGNWPLPQRTGAVHPEQTTPPEERSRPPEPERSAALLCVWAARSETAYRLCTEAGLLSPGNLKWTKVFHSLHSPDLRPFAAALLEGTSGLLMRTLTRLWEQSMLDEEGKESGPDDASPAMGTAQPEGADLATQPESEATRSEISPDRQSLLLSILHAPPPELTAPRLSQLLTGKPPEFADIQAQKPPRGTVLPDLNDQLEWIMLAGHLGDGSRAVITEGAPRAIRPEERTALDTELRGMLNGDMTAPLELISDLNARLLAALTCDVRDLNAPALAQIAGAGWTPEDACEFLIGAGQQLDEWLLGLSEQRRAARRRGHTDARAQLRQSGLSATQPR